MKQMKGIDATKTLPVSSLLFLLVGDI